MVRDGHLGSHVLTSILCLHLGVTQGIGGAILPGNYVGVLAHFHGVILQIGEVTQPWETKSVQPFKITLFLCSYYFIFYFFYDCRVGVVGWHPSDNLFFKAFIDLFFYVLDMRPLWWLPFV